MVSTYSGLPMHSEEGTRHVRRGSRSKFALPLHFAIWNKLTVEARCLVESGADLDAQDDFGRTPLMMCCLENDEGWSTGIATMLLQAGADASLHDANGRDALMFSLIFKRKRMIELLLKTKDYDIHKKDKSKRTVIDYATMTGELPIFDDKLKKRLSKQNTVEIPKRMALRSKSANLAYRRPKTTPACTTIIQDTLTSAKIYASSSEMNTHQFRRLVNKGLEETQKQRRPSVNLVTGLHQRIHPRPSTASPIRRMRNMTAPTSIDCFTMASTEKRRSRPRSASWKSVVPILWEVFAIQNSPSYRNPATPVKQTHEEALGLPPLEDPNEDGTEITGEDGSAQDDNQQPVPRRSSMPASSKSSHPSMKLRRRSEAIGMSSNSVSKFFLSEKKVSDSFDQPVTLGSDVKTEQRVDVAKSSRHNSSNESTTSSSSDEDFVDSPGKQKMNANRGKRSSLPRREKADNATNGANRRGSFPRSNQRQEKEDLSVKQSGGRRASLAIIPSSQKLIIPTSLKDDAEFQDTTDEPSSPRRMQQLNMKNKRRRESILPESPVLPDITEEL